MAYDYSDLVEQTQGWLEQAKSSGWIGKEVTLSLDEYDSRLPELLFNAGHSRPLIVAFMGGTGVGKSSLLNRLAGKAIAKAGIERPTSREVTLFHHRSIALQQLPEQFPLAQIKIAQHDVDSRKNIIWIDMPDFDSIEQRNRQLVLQWLPYIDVLIYVVSPERYRDEKAWRLLLAEGAKHAWLFVLNQWDRGQPEQHLDFLRQLHQAGFIEPVIFKTICTAEPQVDDFDALQSTIVSLATEQLVAQLEQRSLEARKNELRQKLQTFLLLLGQEQSWQQIPGLWQQQWQQTTALLQQGFAWPMQQMATYYAEHAADLLTNAASSNASLWDHWAQARLDDALDELIINADQLGVPATALKNQLSPLRQKAAKIVRTQTEMGAREALANPGSRLQRGFLKTVRLCEAVLPLAAMAWVGYQVFMGFYTSNMTNTHYLGVDFAIHSSLLIVLTWLIPFFILKKSQPSLKKSALRGLNKGLNNALSMIDSDVSVELDNVIHRYREQVSQLSRIIEQCSEVDSRKLPLLEDSHPLNRMLIR